MVYGSNRVMFDISQFYPTISASERIIITECLLDECLVVFENTSDDGLKALLLDKAVRISIDLDIDKTLLDIEQQYKKNRLCLN